MWPIPAGLMVGIKWAAILAIVSMLGYGLKWGYEYHLDQIDAAVNQVKMEAALSEQTAVREATSKLKAQQEAERKALQVELDKARTTSDNLRRMLTIDHDLDRLLQRKPGLILPRVDQGTEEVLKELEELTR